MCAPSGSVKARSMHASPSPAATRVLATSVQADCPSYRATAESSVWTAWTYGKISRAPSKTADSNPWTSSFRNTERGGTPRLEAKESSRHIVTSTESTYDELGATAL